MKRASIEENSRYNTRSSARKKRLNGAKAPQDTFTTPVSRKRRTRSRHKSSSSMDGTTRRKTPSTAPTKSKSNQKPLVRRVQEVEGSPESPHGKVSV